VVNTVKLRKAIKAGNLGEVKELLQGANINEIRLVHGWTSLHFAAKHGTPDVAAAILEYGAEINTTTDMWQTALDIAIGLKKSELAAFLREKGAQSGTDLSLN